MTLARVAIALSLFSSLVLSGCSEKKPPEPPKPAEPPKVEAPKPPPPPPAAEEVRALKECAAPLDIAPTADVKIGERAAKQGGYKLTFTEKDPDVLKLGVLGPINEDLGENMVALKKYAKFFADEKADAIIV